VDGAANDAATARATMSTRRGSTVRSFPHGPAPTRLACCCDVCLTAPRREVRTLERVAAGWKAGPPMSGRGQHVDAPSSMPTAPGRGDGRRSLPARALAMHPAIEAHLGTRQVARVIYGAIIGMALVVALEAHPPRPAVVAATLLATVPACTPPGLFSGPARRSTVGR
jgi:hypothetical protein